jgi:hypothetical protein
MSFASVKTFSLGKVKPYVCSLHILTPPSPVPFPFRKGEGGRLIHITGSN